MVAMIRKTSTVGRILSFHVGSVGFRVSGSRTANPARRPKMPRKTVMDATMLLLSLLVGQRVGSC